MFDGGTKKVGEQIVKSIGNVSYEFVRLAASRVVVGKTKNGGSLGKIIRNNSYKF
jgi:hypothetical protein